MTLTEGIFLALFIIFFIAAALGDIEKLRRRHFEFSVKYQGDYSAEQDQAKQIEEKIAELRKEFSIRLPFNKRENLM